MGIVYNTSVTREGLVLHLDAANKKSYPGNGTTWFDLTENKLNCTLRNTPTFVDNYFQFNGTNEWVSRADTDLINQSDNPKRTIDVWFKTSSNISNRQIIYEEGGAVNSYVIYIQSNLCYIVAASESHGWSKTVFTSPVSTNTWYNAGMILNATQTSLQTNVFSGYINGKIIGVGDGSIMSTHSGDISFAYSSDGYVAHDGDASSGGYLNGSISAIKVYNSALSTDDIAQNFEALRGRYGI